MLRFDKLEKSYGNRPVLQGCSGRFGTGAFALQGPNGIGKSTLLAALAGALPIDGGEVCINETCLHANPIAARQLLAYAPDESPVYRFMRGREFLEFVARARGKAPDTLDDDIAECFGINTHMHTRFGAMSLGTQKKFLLAAAWIGAPRVLLLDEPANGLDAAAREYLATLLQRQSEQSTVLFSTHDHAFIAAAGATPIQMETLQAKSSPVA
ncbi:MAG: ABC transporter ATP-binding protein [Gammaproteobacteria bacterium]|jgi:ABC-2 type transport system ATP-binding protein